MTEVHRLVVSLPDHEKYGLADQMRRASKSVGALIAEGWGLRRSEREFKNYLRRVLGSANEMEAHLDTARLLCYVSDDVDLLSSILHHRIEKSYPARRAERHELHR